MRQKQIKALWYLLAMASISGGNLHLHVDQANLSTCPSGPLTVNCTFSYRGVTDKISKVVSMVLSKLDFGDNQEQDFIELGSLNFFHPDKVIGQPNINATVSGHISGESDRMSYLSIQWSNPNANHRGLYQCEVHGVDNRGRPTAISHKVLLTSEHPEVDQLVDKINDLQRKMERQESQSAQQAETINYLVSLGQNQSDIITKLQIDMDQIRSTVHNQSVQLSNQSDTICKPSLLMKILFDDKFRISQEYQGHRYLLSKDGWDNAEGAQRLCQNFGGYLAKIDDKEEHEFVKGFLNGVPKFTFALISGTDKGHQGTWTYTGSDTVLSYWLWDPEQLSFANEDCLVMIQSSNWKMGDYPCIHKNGDTEFLCEVI